MCEHDTEHSGYIKKCGEFLAEELLAVQKGFCSMNSCILKRANKCNLKPIWCLKCILEVLLLHGLASGQGITFSIFYPCYSLAPL